VDTGWDGWEHPGMTTVGAEGPPTAAPPGAGPHVVPPWSGPRSSSTPPGSRRPPAVDGPFTPERPKASWGVRVIAVLLDSAVVATIVWFATGASVGLATLPLWGGDEDPLPAGTAAWAGGTLLALAVLQAYTGMTPGKRAAGIAVVDAGSGRPIGLAGTILRWLAHFLDAFLMIGYLRAAWHREGRTFADSLLGTVAVRSTRPEPHPWVEAVRGPRTEPATGWSRHVVGGLALVLCAVGAATWVIQGAGGTEGESAATSCQSTGPDATAYVETTARVSWETRLGVERETHRAWSVVAGWSTGDVPDDRLDDTGGTPSVSVQAPDGRTFSSAGDTGFDPGAYWLSDTSPGPVSSAIGVDLTEDPAGWTARVVLTDDGGAVLAECSVPVPAAEPVGVGR
jgi:Mce-associated membrane protein